MRAPPAEEIKASPSLKEDHHESSDDEEEEDQDSSENEDDELDYDDEDDDDEDMDEDGRPPRGKRNNYNFDYKNGELRGSRTNCKGHWSKDEVSVHSLSNLSLLFILAQININ
jgi:hypothetical protein